MAFKDFFTQVPQEGGTKTSTFETLIDAIVKGYVTAKKDDPKARKFGEIYSVAKQAEAGIEQVQSRRQSEEVKKLFRDAALSMDDVYSKTDISHDERLSRARNIKNNFFKLALPKSQNDDVLKYGKAMDKRIKEWEKEGISVNKMKATIVDSLAKNEAFAGMSAEDMEKVAEAQAWNKLYNVKAYSKGKEAEARAIKQYKMNAKKAKKQMEENKEVKTNFIKALGELQKEKQSISKEMGVMYDSRSYVINQLVKNDRSVNPRVYDKLSDTELDEALVGQRVKQKMESIRRFMGNREARIFMQEYENSAMFKNETPEAQNMYRNVIKNNPLLLKKFYERMIKILQQQQPTGQ